MSSSAPSQPPRPDEEEPLDPRLEAVAVKMRRLSLVSSLIMFVGIFAVLGVILYRSLGGGSSSYPADLSPDEVRTLVLSDQPGATIQGVTTDERSLFVTVTGDQGSSVLEIDRATWQVVSVLRLGN